MTQDAEGRPVILIHGDYWRVAHVAEQVTECANVLWEQKQWHAGPALVQPNGIVTQYAGQPHDPSKSALVQDAWDHDHCEICWWKLYQADDIEHSIGYTDGRNWVCTECYTQFLAPGTTLPVA